MGPGPGTVCPVRLNTVLTEAEQALYQDQGTVKRILDECRVIAIVGLSTDRQKASSFVASYLRTAGYTVVPVNPRAKEILGLRCYPSLRDVPPPVDLVDIFRPAHEAKAIVEEAIACGAKAVWMQLRLVNLEAAARARAAGLLTVVDRCVKMEHGRYSGGLHEAGMNTEIISPIRSHRFI
jgi:predicted CoA-binding protein